MFNLRKKNGSRIPTALLSQMAAFDEDSTTTIQHSQQLRLTRRPSSTLHIYDLSPKVKNSHLEDFLRPYSGGYVLQWIDDTNALAIFKHEHQMRKALGDLNGGLFKVKAYQDSNPETEGEDLLILSGSVPKKVPLKVKDHVEVPLDYRQVVKGARSKNEQYAPPKLKDVKKGNMFSALSNAFGETELLFEEEEKSEPRILNDTHSTKEKPDITEKEKPEISEKEKTDVEETKENWEDYNSDEN